jgi:hypothetical protein
VHAERVWVPVPCVIAHDMLVRQSGYDYGYDRKNWSEWNKSQYPSPSENNPQSDTENR